MLCGKWEVGIPRPRAPTSSLLRLALANPHLPYPLPPPSIPRVNQYICPNRYSPRCMLPYHLPGCSHPVMNNRLQCIPKKKGETVLSRGKSEHIWSQIFYSLWSRQSRHLVTEPLKDRNEKHNLTAILDPGDLRQDFRVRTRLGQNPRLLYSTGPPNQLVSHSQLENEPSIIW